MTQQIKTFKDYLEFMNYLYTVPKQNQKSLMLSECVLNDFHIFLSENHRERVKDFESILKERQNFINETRRKIRTTD